MCLNVSVHRYIIKIEKCKIALQKYDTKAGEQKKSYKSEKTLKMCMTNKPDG